MYRIWNPHQAQRMVARTHATLIGVECNPIAGPEYGLFDDRQEAEEWLDYIPHQRQLFPVGLLEEVFGLGGSHELPKGLRQVF